MRVTARLLKPLIHESLGMTTCTRLEKDMFLLIVFRRNLEDDRERILEETLDRDGKRLCNIKMKNNTTRIKYKLKQTCKCMKITTTIIK